MKKLFNLLIFFVLFYGCRSTELAGSWKPGPTAPKKYNKIGIVVLLPDESNKIILESEVVAAMKNKGIRAIETYDIFPLVRKKNLSGNMNMKSEKQKAYVRERVQKLKLDGLMIIGLFNVKKEVRYNESPSITMAVPVYGYGYTGYYSYVYSSIHETSQYTTTTTYFLESNLYDVASEKLIWSGQTKTKNPNSIERDSKTFAKLIVNEILKKQVVKP